MSFKKYGIIKGDVIYCTPFIFGLFIIGYYTTWWILMSVPLTISVMLWADFCARIDNES